MQPVSSVFCGGDDGKIQGRSWVLDPEERQLESLEEIGIEKSDKSFLEVEEVYSSSSSAESFTDPPGSHHLSKDEAAGERTQGGLKFEFDGISNVDLSDYVKWEQFSADSDSDGDIDSDSDSDDDVSRQQLLVNRWERRIRRFKMSAVGIGKRLYSELTDSEDEWQEQQKVALKSPRFVFHNVVSQTSWNLTEGAINVLLALVDAPSPEDFPHSYTAAVMGEELFLETQGSLRDLWKGDNGISVHPPSVGTARWLAREISGLAAIVERTGGSDTSDFTLRPDNILWLKYDKKEKKNSSFQTNVNSTPEDFTTLGIAVTGFDSDSTTESAALRAPESLSGSECGNGCRLWALGCVLLDLMLWHIRGYDEGVFDFALKRQRDVEGPSILSYVYHDKTLQRLVLKPSVIETLWMLRVDARRSSFTNDVLDLIEGGLLIVEPKRRMTIQSAKEQLDRIYGNCMRSSAYSTKASNAEEDDRTDLESLFSKFSQSSIDSYTTMSQEQTSSTALLVELLLLDEELSSLYRSAKSQVSLQKLKTHLYGFLRAFGKELLQEAQDIKTRLASVFIRKSAKHIAEGIGARLGSDDEVEIVLLLPEYDPRDKEKMVDSFLSSLDDKTEANQRHLRTNLPIAKGLENIPEEASVAPDSSGDGSSQDADTDIESQADEINDHLHLDEVKRFLITSEALLNMKRELRKWLKVDEGKEEHSDDPAKSIELSPRAGDDNDVDIVEQAQINNRRNHLPATGSVNFGDSRPTSVVTKSKRISIAKVASSVLIMTGFLEPPIPPGHRRIRWKNNRGKMLRDDYIEHEPGALDALDEYLNSPSGCHGSAPGITKPSSPTPSPPSMTSAHLQGTTSTLASTGGHQYPHNALATDDIELGATNGPPLYLCLCADRKKYKVHLDQKPISDVSHDKELFVALKQHYQGERKGLWRSYLSIKTVESIHFTKFLYHGPVHNDPQQHSEHCSTKCNCLPPPERVPDEYLCNPIPPKYSPPVGPRLLMDYFTDPHAINANRTWVLEQLPKRARDKLDPDPLEPIEAWGLYFKEGWHWTKIWWILGLGFFPPSLLFGVLWGVLKQDIQGAFGVASWYMTAVAIIFGIVGTHAWAQ